MVTKSGLNILGLPEIFQSIADNLQTGTLTVESGGQQKYIYFKQGKVIQVSSPQKPSILANGLRRYPDLDDESFEYLCEKQRERGESLYNILLDEEGGQEFIIALCQYQIIEEVCELFNWPDTTFEFTEGAPSPSLFDDQLLDLPIDINTNALLMEAARRHDEWNVIREILPSNYDVPYRVKGREMHNASVEEKMVLSFVNGVRDIGEILEDVRLSPFLALKALANLLKHAYIALKTATQLRRMADMDVFRRDRLKCIRLYERAESLGEEDVELLSWLALAYEAMGMNNKAADKYRQMGFVCIKEGSIAAAIRAFEKVAALDPQDLEAPKMLIALCYTTGEPEKAGQKTRDYARRLALKGNYDLAIQVLNQANERAGALPENLDFLATLYHERGNHAEAIKTYENLAELYREKEDNQSAVTVYRKILNIDKNYLTVRMALAKSLAALGQQKEALEEYRNFCRMLSSSEHLDDGPYSYYLMIAAEKILEQEPENPEAFKWLADACIARNDKKRAKEALVELLGTLDQGEEDLPLLVDIYSRLVAMEPDNLEYRGWLAEAYRKMDRVREAIQEYYTLGMAAADKGELPKAMRAFDQFLSLSFERTNFAVRLKRANLLVQEGRTEEAINEFKLIGYLSLGLENYRKAVDAFCRVVALEPNEQLPCYEEIAKLYEKLGDKHRAVVSYQKYVRRHARHKNYGEALRVCDKILAIAPDDQWTLEHKKRFQAVHEFIDKMERKALSKSGSYQMQGGSRTTRHITQPVKEAGTSTDHKRKRTAGRGTSKDSPFAMDITAQKKLQDLFNKISQNSERYPHKEKP